MKIQVSSKAARWIDKVDALCTQHDNQEKIAILFLYVRYPSRCVHFLTAWRIQDMKIKIGLCVGKPLRREKREGERNPITAYWWNCVQLVGLYLFLCKLSNLHVLQEKYITCEPTNRTLHVMSVCWADAVKWLNFYTPLTSCILGHQVRKRRRWKGGKEKRKE